MTTSWPDNNTIHVTQKQFVRMGYLNNSGTAPKSASLPPPLPRTPTLQNGALYTKRQLLDTMQVGSGTIATNWPLRRIWISEKCRGWILHSSRRMCRAIFGGRIVGPIVSTLSTIQLLERADLQMHIYLYWLKTLDLNTANILFGPYNWNGAENETEHCSWDTPTTKNCKYHFYEKGLIHLVHAAGAEIYVSVCL